MAKEEGVGCRQVDRLGTSERYSATKQDAFLQYNPLARMAPNDKSDCLLDNCRAWRD